MIYDADDNLVVRYAGSPEHGYPYNPVSGRRFKGDGLSPVQADALPVTGNISALCWAPVLEIAPPLVASRSSSPIMAVLKVLMSVQAVLLHFTRPSLQVVFRSVSAQLHEGVSHLGYHLPCCNGGDVDEPHLGLLLPEFGYLRPGTALNLPFPSQGPTTAAALTALIPPPLAVRAVINC